MMTKRELKKLEFKQINRLGMELTAFKYKGVIGTLAEEDRWATIYDIESTNPDKGECQECLKLLKAKYFGKDFGCSVALNDKMSYILKKLGIKEYKKSNLYDQTRN